MNRLKVGEVARLAKLYGIKIETFNRGSGRGVNLLGVRTMNFDEAVKQLEKVRWAFEWSALSIARMYNPR